MGLLDLINLSEVTVIDTAKTKDNEVHITIVFVLHQQKPGKVN